MKNIQSKGPKGEPDTLPLLPVENLKAFKTGHCEYKTTSYLRPGMKFTGFQFSGSNQYKVDVKLIDVDLELGFISGSLTIYELTDLNPKITTFFDGEMIGPHHSFETKNINWGSSWNNDVQHWARFDPWRKLNLNLNQPDNSTYYENPLGNQFLYFRWKELFLLDDPHMTDIKGASFAGFYYICFNQVDGALQGMYYHKFSDKFQRLMLSPIDSTSYSVFEYA